jgi:hypothetical protein
MTNCLTDLIPIYAQFSQSLQNVNPDTRIPAGSFERLEAGVTRGGTDVTGERTDSLPDSFSRHGCLRVIFTSIVRPRLRTLMLVPFPALGSQLSQQTFGSREQFLKTAARLHSVVLSIEDRDLNTDLGSILTLRGVYDAMHRRIRILAGFEQI